MDWIKKHFFRILLALAGIIVLPWLIDVLIFSNAYPSKVSNDGWAGFLGGYIGAIIGALTTLITIRMQIKDNEKQRLDDEIKSMTPYLCIVNFSFVPHGPAYTDLTLMLKNVGLQAACDIALYENDLDDDRHLLYFKHTTLGVNDQAPIQIRINLKKSEEYMFSFYDLRGDRYTQRLFISPQAGDPCIVESCGTLRPELDRTREEYEAMRPKH